MNKNQFDEILINALYMLGGTNDTPFKDIKFFEEEKNIDDGIYYKTMQCLEGLDDDEFDEDYDYSSIDINEIAEDITSKINVDQIVDDVMDRLSKKDSSELIFPGDAPIIILDPEIYKDLDVNRFDLTLNNFKKIDDDDLKKIANIEEKIKKINIEMLNKVKMGIKSKDVYDILHKRKNSLIEDLYNNICDKKTDEIENIMTDFCNYVINSQYCKDKSSVITMVGSTVVCVRNFMINEVDNLFKPILIKAGKDSDVIMTLVNLL